MPKNNHCPHCNQPTQEAYKPFCSKRCADVDLGKWLGGQYSIPSPEPLSENDIEEIIEQRQKSDPQEY